MTTTEYPTGIDCVWIAEDKAGMVAAFVTGGEGPIPDIFLRSDSIDIHAIEGLICELPKICGADMLVPIERPDDFIAMAQRGFFVYDWRDLHRPRIDCSNLYEPIAIPTSPITTGSLSDALRTVISNIKFTDLTFSRHTPIDIFSTR